jgi:ABC-type lipoprotein export system ATPase subunit
LLRLVAKTEEAKSMIRQKEVLFMIGNTGSGKSTNILKLLEY